ncbi:LOW QUALITY PROTEIN: WPP domain-interacting tail-anchored protein 2-like [Primulina eburnea]|uniref:LOW QUALITY PROTEIN: WPP domain-interacting tail-anchored protein 2-like n=1 Tax=Primulina eburnea TaxID=1245227 RepID=UPI003C6C1BDA
MNIVTMAANDSAASASDIADPDMQKFWHEGLPYNSKEAGELQNALKVSSEVDMTLAYSSDKLATLENLLLHVLVGENDIGMIDTEDDEISAEMIEKTFTFDLLTAILNLELRELDNLMCGLQDLIVDSLHKISSSGQSVDLVTGMVSKLHDSEEIVKRSQERVLEMKIQLAKLQMSSISFKPNGWKSDVIMGAKEEFQQSSAEWKPQIQTVEQRRIFKMLEKSLMGEQELEKELIKSKQNEEDLNLKTRLIEQVSVCMEEAAEVAWGRFLEADNTAEVLMGIAKEMLGKLQILQLNLGNSIKREEETKLKLQDCINQLNSKEISIQRLDSNVATLLADNAEATRLRNRVKILEGKLDEAESRLKERDLSNEMSQQKLKEMEDEIESLKESIYDSETQAGKGEEKITHLTQTNLELSEELDFLKGSSDSNTKKASLFEKQVLELDLQLQHARLSSEASLEQQNNLYNAIWDMEILIDDLKQKVSKAESKAESTEERCIELSVTNSKLNEELDFLRSRIESMESCSNQENAETKARAKDINIKANFIMDTVVQLAVERERIQKQLTSLTKENEMLRANIWNNQKHEPELTKSCNDKGFLSSQVDLVDGESSIASTVTVTELSSNKFQEDKSFNDVSVTSTTSIHWNETSSTNSAKPRAGLILNSEADGTSSTGNSRRTLLFIAALIVLLSVFAAQFFRQKLATFVLIEN